MTEPTEGSNSSLKDKVNKDIKSSPVSLKKTLTPSKKGVSIAGGVAVLGPLVPFIWNKQFPEWQMTPEIAASASGGLVIVLGMVYETVLFFKSILVAVLKKYGINPEQDEHSQFRTPEE